MRPILSLLLLCAAGCAGGSRDADPAPPELHAARRHHSIDYLELPVTGMARSKQFYGDAFGWSFNDYGPDYTGIQKPGGGEFGGLRLDAEARRGGPLLILYSVDLEASMSAVQSAGGRIVVEPFAFPGGRRFHFTDPSGNELAVWSDQ